MEKLNTFVKQARDKGRSDEQIRQFLIGRGIPAQSIDAALSANPEPSRISSDQSHQPQTKPAESTPDDAVRPYAHQQNQPSKPQDKDKKRKIQISVKLPGRKPLILTGLILVALGSGSTYAMMHASSAGSNQEAVSRLITAMQNQDKSAADALLTENAKSQFQQEAGSRSFYEACLLLRGNCTNAFRTEFIDNAEKSETEYSAEDGAKGVETTLTLKKEQVPSANCKPESTSTLTISTVSSGGKWSIDKITPQYDVSSALCKQKS